MKIRKSSWDKVIMSGMIATVGAVLCQNKQYWIGITILIIGFVSFAYCFIARIINALDEPHDSD